MRIIRERIVQALRDNQSLEIEQDGTAWYYLHLTSDGEIASTVYDADITLSTPARYVDALWEKLFEEAKEKVEDEEMAREIACDNFWSQVYDLETESELPTAGIEPAGTYMSVNAGQVGKKDIFVVVSEWVETGTPKSAMVILHLSNVNEGEQGGGETDCPFSISNNMMQPINSISYEGGDLNYWMSTYGCESVWQVEFPGQSIFVAMSKLGASISTIECYDFSTESLISAPEDIVDMEDGSWNIWMGDSLSDKTVYLKITDSDGKSYGLILGVTP